ncbi:hypothetical protein CN085_14675 [Sinorhizobium meliloti]|nr:hypothetical protein CN085_14675 [Sinorhizobium meliloti]
MRQDHAAGDKLFVDYAGDTVTVVVDRLSGKTRQAHLFVAVLGASSLSYAQARWSETLPDWIECHILALEFFGGAPALLVPDNAKVAIIKACHFDPQVNRTYCGMAAHYGSAVLPTRPRRPRDKAKVEAAVVSSNVGCWAGCAIASSIVWPRSMRRLANCSMISMISAFCAVSAPRAANCSRSLIVRLCDRCLSNVMSLPNGVSGAPGWIITSRSSGTIIPFPIALPASRSRLVSPPIRSRSSTRASELRLTGAPAAAASTRRSPIICPLRIAALPTGRLNGPTRSLCDGAGCCAVVRAQGFRACLGIIRLNKSFGPHGARECTPVELADPIRRRLSVIPGIEIAIIQEGLAGGASPIQISVLGDDRAVLDKAAADLIAGMRSIPGIVDINSSADEEKAILSVRLKREQASDLGIDLAVLSDTLSALVGGEDVGTWSDELGETRNVVVRLPQDQRANLAVIRQLTLKSSSSREDVQPALVRLDQVADIDLAPAASEIRRLDQMREVRIAANVSGPVVGDATEDLEVLVARQKLPSGYRIKFGGDAEDMGKAATSMLKALVMAVIFIYVVLASQFGSFSQPAAIMAALPLSLVGVLAGLLIAGSTINMFSMIGFIMLMGLVTKNGILLVDFANRERRRGLPLSQALENAAMVRLRPIVMTTLAMIFGMLPPAMTAAGAGAQRAPMAHAVIGGLISSTILTLVVVPAALSLIDSVTLRVTRRSRALPQHSDATQAR